MSGISSTGTSTAQQSNILQTNVGPITFNGVASGIDWNSVISKETALTLAPTTQYNNQIQTLSTKNQALITISSLLASVQNSLQALSDPAQYQTFLGQSSNTADATAAGIPGVSATPGVYTVTADSLATATQVTSATAKSVGKQVTSTVAIASDNFQITPVAGPSGQGQLTVDGVAIKYSPTDAVGANLNALLATIQFQVSQVDAGFTASYSVATDTVSFLSSDQPISVGSPSDSGNLATVLKLDIANVQNTTTMGTIVSAGPISGLNPNVLLTQNSANLITAVTAGTFSINGVSFTVTPSTDSIANILSRINTSTAGVVATYDNATGQIQITNQQTGPRSIVFGSSLDTSNFLSAVGLPDRSGGHGATTQVGQQASVTLQNAAGGTTTFYSSSNQVTNAIQGISIDLLSPTTTPFTIQVSQDSTQLVNNIQAFASAYNAALTELNNALAAPVVQQNSGTNSQSLLNASAQLLPGGPLFGDLSISTLRDQLISFAQTIIPSSGTSFNSLDAIGLSLTSTFSVLSATQQGAQSNASAGTTVSGALTSTVQQGTDGTFQAFNLQAFQTAFTQNPSAIQNLFNDPTGGINVLFGTYLTGVTGVPTLLNNGPVGQIPQTALLQADENQNTDQINDLQTLIQQIQDNATQQANALQNQANSAETAIAGYQAEQQQVTQLVNSGQL
jgi:flagellar capping protein FliD